MNQRNYPSVIATVRAAFAVAIVATIAFAAMPGIAATHSDQGARIEGRINDMHTKLKITAAEEDQWAKVADVMRSNAAKMDELNSARAANAKTMNAVEDIQSYGVIVDAHASEIKNFAAAFAPLYTSMSDAQKMEADELFRHGAAPHKSMKKN